MQLRLNTSEENFSPNDIIEFWFSDSSKPLWFARNNDFDQLIKNKYSSLHKSAAEGKLDHWSDSPNGALALVIILDQFSRNLFRDSAEAFASDSKAIAISQSALTNGFSKLLKDEHLYFLYMPFMHSEDIDNQELGIQLFSNLANASALKYAIMHRDIIKRFGRFPHRNKVLNRKSTDEEIQFLKEPNSSF